MKGKMKVLYSQLGIVYEVLKESFSSLSKHVVYLSIRHILISIFDLFLTRKFSKVLRTCFEERPIFSMSPNCTKWE